MWTTSTIPDCIEIDGSMHNIVGTLRPRNRDCDKCWIGYPKRCECKGYKHGVLVMINNDRDPAIKEKCEKCGKETIKKEIWR